MSGPPSDLYKIEDVVGTERDESNNAITAQLGDVQTETPTSQGAEWWQHSGFCSRPPNATTSSGKAAAQALALEGSDRDRCIASKDIRGQQLYANLQPGEACLYGAGTEGTAQGRVLCKANGDVVLYSTSDNTSNGLGVYLKIGPSGFRIESPYGRIVMDATGIHLVHASGARIDLGGIGGLPAPLDQISSYCRMSAATVHCNGGVATQLGPLPTLAVAVSVNPEITGPIPSTPSGTPSLVIASGNVTVTP